MCSLQALGPDRGCQTAADVVINPAGWYICILTRPACNKDQGSLVKGGIAVRCKSTQLIVSVHQLGGSSNLQLRVLAWV